MANIDSNFLTLKERLICLRLIGLLFFFVSFLNGNLRLFVIGLAAFFISNNFSRFRFLNPLDSGELRERIYNLAARAGVKLSGVYILNSQQQKIVNAYVTLDNKIILTDYSLKYLNKQQIDTVIGHELGHLKHRHLQILLKINWGIIIFQIAIFISFTNYLELNFIGLSLLVIFASIVTYLRFKLLKLSRNFEYVADREAVKLTGDAMAYIRALNKISPQQSQKYSTHPPTWQRIKAIAKNNNICQKELLQIIKTADINHSYYTLNANFFTRFKRKIIAQKSQAILTFKIGLPTAIAGIIQLFNLSSFWYLAGLILSLTVFFSSYKWISGWGENELRAKIKLKLKKQGFAIDKYRGIAVGFALGSQPSLDDKLLNWDMGYLFLTRDRLCYVGEEIRFSLSRKQIKAIFLDKDILSWYNYRRIYISWYEAGNNTVHSFNFVNTNIYFLEKQLQKWLEYSENSKITPYLSSERLLNKLSAPKIISASSNFPNNEFEFDKLFWRFIELFLLAIVVGFMVNLSFGNIFYLILVTCLTASLETIYYHFRKYLP